MLLATSAAWGQAPFDEVKQLAARIAAQIPAHATVALSFENRSSLSADDANRVRVSLEQQLRASGLDFGESETKLRIVASEDPDRYLLIAQTGSGVAMVSWNKPPRIASEFPMTIRRTAMCQQREPILDVRSSNGTLQVLEPSRLVQYIKKDGAWQMDHATNTPPDGPVSRDPRAQIGANGADRWVPGRDYMDGGERGFYYSKAVTGFGTLFAGTDGRTRLYGQKPEPLLVINNWGSDIVEIDSDCGAKKQVLATAPTSDDSQDRIQAFEFSGASYAAVSEPLPLAGLVTALWPADSPDSVTLVVHNNQTGTYEASRISLVCTQ